ncbi:malto-oligosyltrehalose synthase, partial [Corynebacterium heidelbergense]
MPDIYQGTEFHTDYLVDPDNRRKVDYAARQAALDRIGRGAIDSPDHEKLHIISTALRIRKNIDPAASYLPVMASGEKDRYMLGMMRGEDMIALVTRQPIGLKDAGGWGDTTVALPAGIWEDQLNRCRVHEGQVRLDDLFSARGQALLTRMTT